MAEPTLSSDESIALLWLRTGNAGVEKFVDERPELGAERFRYNRGGPHGKKQLALVRTMGQLESRGFVTIGPISIKARRVTLTAAGELAADEERRRYGRG